MCSAFFSPTCPSDAKVDRALEEALRKKFVRFGWGGYWSFSEWSTQDYFDNDRPPGTLSPALLGHLAEGWHLDES